MQCLILFSLWCKKVALAIKEKNLSKTWSGQSDCNGKTEAWGVRIHMQAFINKHGQNAGRVEHQQTDMARTRHKKSPVSRQSRSAANVIKGAKQRELIQVHVKSRGAVVA